MTAADLSCACVWCEFPAGSGARFACTGSGFGWLSTVGEPALACAGGAF